MTFKLKAIAEINGKVTFYKLLINGKWRYKEFETLHERGNFGRELVTIQSILQNVADLITLPKKKWRNITPKKVAAKEFEAKSSNLRVYCFKIKSGYVIVDGGQKNKQKSDILRFRKIKNKYFKSLR